MVAAGPPLALWGICAPLAALEGGCRNTVLCTQGLAQDYVFKSTRRDEAALSWLLPVQAIARNCGFCVPEMKSSARGALSEAGWTCESFLKGRPLTGAPPPELEDMIRAFHRQAANLPQRPGFRASFDFVHGECVGGDVDLNCMPEDLSALCRRIWKQVAARPTGIVHGDLHPGNMLRMPDGQIALLDWDEARRDLHLFDAGTFSPAPREADALARAARLAWEVACSWNIEPDYARKLARRLEREAEHMVGDR